ncbi:hypothetical protein [Paramaledivibacter caminithermalis]|jgi:hypothetical protein|uniref:Uncharacterized protein n=1 Tax=Paramaledivibacter caminithermalis (strain DSM 15212 / CIP 107654 / DViRD3) TaxID=1121301 RepID=A0A1M6U3Z2_PARC5|nr:hypothetical protein [Paramaledivibacter caminithermalis]SHK63890.1 hypothetical protein SAMN02745912_03864 [Paramaledivibacter caminithermalis DSM 15212]
MKKSLILVLSLLLVITMPIGSFAQTKDIELTDKQIEQYKAEFEIRLKEFRETNDMMFREMNKKSIICDGLSTRGVDPGVDPVYPNKTKTFYNMDISYENDYDNNKGDARAKASVSDPKLNLYSISGGHLLNSYAMAEGRLGKEFYYAGNSNKSMVVNFVGSYDWTIANALLAAQGNSDINIWLIVEDLDNGVEVDKTLVSESYWKSAGTWNGKNSFNKSLEINAKPGHVYNAYIKAEVVSDCMGMGSTSASAHKDFGNHYIKLDKIKISW